MIVEQGEWLFNNRGFYGKGVLFSILLGVAIGSAGATPAPFGALRASVDLTTLTDRAGRGDPLWATVVVIVAAHLMCATRPAAILGARCTAGVGHSTGLTVAAAAIALLTASTGRGDPLWAAVVVIVPAHLM